MFFFIIAKFQKMTILSVVNFMSTSWEEKFHLAKFVQKLAERRNFTRQKIPISWGSNMLEEFPKKKFCQKNLHFLQWYSIITKYKTYFYMNNQGGLWLSLFTSSPYDLGIKIVAQHSFIQLLLLISLALLCWQNSASSINCHSFNEKNRLFGGKAM
jgi:hypothetical protein